MVVKRISFFIFLVGIITLTFTTKAEAQNINTGESYAFTFFDNQTFNGKVTSINNEQRSFQVQLVGGNDVYTFDFDGNVLISGGNYKQGDKVIGINPVDQGTGQSQQKANTSTKKSIFNYWKNALVTHTITDFESDDLYRITDGEKEGNNHWRQKYPDFPVDFVFDLVGVDPVPITKVDIHYWNWGEEDKAKDIEVYFGNSATGPWQKAANYTVPQELGTHTIPTTPGKASHVKLTVKSNYGGQKLFLMEFGIFSNGRRMMQSPPKAGMSIRASQEVEYVEYDYTYPDHNDNYKIKPNKLKIFERESRPWHGAPVTVYTLDMSVAGPKMREWAQQKAPSDVIIERLQSKKYEHFFKKAEVIKTNNTGVSKTGLSAFTNFYPIPPGFYKTVAKWQDEDRVFMTQVFYLGAGENEVIFAEEKVELGYKKCGKQSSKEPKNWEGCEWVY